MKRIKLHVGRVRRRDCSRKVSATFETEDGKRIGVSLRFIDQARFDIKASTIERLSIMAERFLESEKQKGTP